eukprot:jgi/Picre1/36009/NNA_003466.t1
MLFNVNQTFPKVIIRSGFTLLCTMIEIGRETCMSENVGMTAEERNMVIRDRENLVHYLGSEVVPRLECLVQKDYHYWGRSRPNIFTEKCRTEDWEVKKWKSWLGYSQDVVTLRAGFRTARMFVVFDTILARHTSGILPSLSDGTFDFRSDAKANRRGALLRHFGEAVMNGHLRQRLPSILLLLDECLEERRREIIQTSFNADKALLKWQRSVMQAILHFLDPLAPLMSSSMPAGKELRRLFRRCAIWTVEGFWTIQKRCSVNSNREDGTSDLDMLSTEGDIRQELESGACGTPPSLDVVESLIQIYHCRHHSASIFTKATRVFPASFRPGDFGWTVAKKSILFLDALANVSSGRDEKAVQAQMLQEPGIHVLSPILGISMQERRKGHAPD